MRTREGGERRHESSSAARAAAGIVAACAIAGIVAQAAAGIDDDMPLLATAWGMAGYFTIIANVAVAAGFACLATGRSLTPRTLGGLVMTILLVGIVHATLLDGLHHLTGLREAANRLMHRATPVGVPLWWLVCAQKGRLTRRDPWYWLAPPLVYLPYALARGLTTGRFAYPFIDPAQIGWGGVAFRCAAIAAGFLLTGGGLLMIDRLLARHGRA